MPSQAEGPRQQEPEVGSRQGGGQTVMKGGMGALGRGWGSAGAWKWKPA